MRNYLEVIISIIHENNGGTYEEKMPRTNYLHFAYRV